MKNANGYGSITKLSGKRRRPWAIVKTTGWTEDGKRIRQYLGYYRTRAEAVKALADYNDNPYDISGYSFAELFAKWSLYKYPTISRSNISSYNASYNKCEALHDQKIQTLKFEDLQKCIDPLSPASGKKMKILFCQMYEYAEKRNLIGRNFTRLLEVKPEEQSDLHMRFTDAELSQLWDHSNDEYVAVILMLIYSGVRPGELFALETKDVNLDERYFEIKNGKNKNAVRKVPIHFRTLPFFELWCDKGCRTLVTAENKKPFNFASEHRTYTQTYFNDVLERLGILYFDGKKHHPDDTRHTFTSMWTEKRLSEVYRRKIQGHSGKGVGEQVYTHISFLELLDEIDKL